MCAEEAQILGLWADAPVKGFQCVDVIGVDGANDCYGAVVEHDVCFPSVWNGVLVAVLIVGGHGWDS